MADTLLLRALKSQPKTVNLSNKHLDKLPRIIGRLRDINQLQLKNNSLSSLPAEFSNLVQLECLNLGNNKFEDLPEELKLLISLEKLHFFSNQLSRLNATVLSNLKNLTLLNLNNNKLQTIPKEICRLTSLRHLSIENNILEVLPAELCALSTLEELRLANNSLTSLPLEFGFLVSLERLYIQKNKIRELPESISRCYRLRLLDVAANDLRIFPTEIADLPLKELFCEVNPLLQHVPVHSVQEEEVLSLKEISARYIMKELKDRWSYLRHAIRHYPQIKDMLSQASRCAVCGDSFLNTWLECVKFVDAKKVFKIKNSVQGTVPVRALLCSYKCFNAEGHSYFGVAFP